MPDTDFSKKYCVEITFDVDITSHAHKGSAYARYQSAMQAIHAYFDMSGMDLYKCGARKHHNWLIALTKAPTENGTTLSFKLTSPILTNNDSLQQIDKALMALQRIGAKRSISYDTKFATDADACRKLPAWKDQDAQLKKMWANGDNPVIMAAVLGRAPAAVFIRATRIGLVRRFSQGRKPKDQNAKRIKIPKLTFHPNPRKAIGDTLRLIRESQGDDIAACRARLKTPVLKSSIERIENGDEKLPVSVVRAAITEICSIYSSCKAIRPDTRSCLDELAQRLVPDRQRYDAA